MIAIVTIGRRIIRQPVLEPRDKLSSKTSTIRKRNYCLAVGRLHADSAKFTVINIFVCRDKFMTHSNIYLDIKRNEIKFSKTSRGSSFYYCKAYIIPHSTL